jgi:beta-glucanase (GH16 family)
MKTGVPSLVLRGGLMTLFTCGCAAVVGMQTPRQGQEATIDIDQFVLTFSDEFVGQHLDETRWFTDPYRREDHQQQHIINDEKQAYVPDALVVTNGLLRMLIEKRKALYAGHMMDYASGLISTRKGGFGQRYGYFEIRCRMPRAKGLWPAFWLVPREGNHPGSPGSEIDIMEFWSHKEEQRYSVNIHWDGYREEHRDDIHHIPVWNPSGSFHTYGAELTPTEVVFYLDRNEVARYSGPGVSHDIMHVVANCAVVEVGADDEALPDVFEIDYIRVYKRIRPDSD